MVDDGFNGSLVSSQASQSSKCWSEYGLQGRKWYKLRACNSVLWAFPNSQYWWVSLCCRLDYCLKILTFQEYTYPHVDYGVGQLHLFGHCSISRYGANNRVKFAWGKGLVFWLQCTMKLCLVNTWSKEDVEKVATSCLINLQLQAEPHSLDQHGSADSQSTWRWINNSCEVSKAISANVWDAEYDPYILLLCTAKFYGYIFSTIHSGNCVH